LIEARRGIVLVGSKSWCRDRERPLDVCRVKGGDDLGIHEVVKGTVFEVERVVNPN
jgi:hypothetical protein